MQENHNNNQTKYHFFKRLQQIQHLDLFCQVCNHTRIHKHKNFFQLLLVVDFIWIIRLQILYFDWLYSVVWYSTMHIHW